MNTIMLIVAAAFGQAASGGAPTGPGAAEKTDPNAAAKASQDVTQVATERATNFIDGLVGILPNAWEPSVREALNTRWLGNPLRNWIAALLILLVAWLVFHVVKWITQKRLRAWAARTSTKWDDVLLDVVADVRWVLLLPAALWLASGALRFGDVEHDPALNIAVHKWLRTFSIIGLCVQVLLSSRIVVNAALKNLLDRSAGQNGEPDPGIATSVGVLRFIAMAVIGSLVLLAALSNLGFDVTAFVTSLGIGGIAIALAVQNILGDLFASMTILFDKPFVVGDSIKVGDKEGRVERIGIKTTRLRAPSGEQLVFSNSDLVKSCLHNYKRMLERRIAFTFGVTYDTKPELLELVPGIVRAAVERRQQTRFERCHFFKLDTDSLDYEVVYHMLTSDYQLYMDTQQGINLELVREFAKRGIRFALPTPMVVASGGGERAAPRDDRAAAASGPRGADNTAGRPSAGPDLSSGTVR